MIIILKPQADESVAAELLALIEKKGLKPLHMPGSERVVLGALGDERVLAQLKLEHHPMVESVKPILAPYKLVSREFSPPDTVVHLGAAPFGGYRFSVVATAHEAPSDEALDAFSKSRAGALAVPAELASQSLQRRCQSRGIEVVVQVRESSQVPDAAGGGLWIRGAQMQNTALLDAVAAQPLPVVLERGRCARLDELLIAAERIAQQGNLQIILCEAGVRSFETAAPRSLDLSAIPYLKTRTHLPVIVAPCASGPAFASALAKAALASGADGLAVHIGPSAELVDAAPGLASGALAPLVDALTPFVIAAGRGLAEGEDV